MHPALIVVLAMTVACTTPMARNDDADAGGADASTDHLSTDPDAGSDCHWDCFGYLSCANGIVTEWAHTPVPCERWTGECPRTGETYTCARGCRTDGASVPTSGSDSLAVACEEGRPKKAGDPCTTEDDCLPTPAIPDGMGHLVNTYLTCDGTTCVTRPPPDVPDYLGACGEGLFGAVPPGYHGILAAPACSGGLCLYYRRHDVTCVDQGCTLRCAGDQDCPQGSACVEFDAVSGACKPGGPYSLGEGLVCR
jgi:hypothetical protein